MQKQQQDEARHIKVKEFGAAYIRGLSVISIFQKMTELWQKRYTCSHAMV